MEQSDIKLNTIKLKKFIAEKFEKSELDNDSLVEIITLCGEYLNLMTVSDYAKSKNIRYTAAIKDYNGRQNIELFGVKFVIDND